MNYQNKTEIIKTGIALPIISAKEISLCNQTWKVYFYEEHYQVLFENSGEWKEGFIERLCQFALINRGNKFPVNDYRESITFECIPFLAAIFSKKREIRLYTRRASRELFLIESIEEYGALPNQKELLGGREEDYIKLKNHLQRCVSVDAKTFPSQIEKLTIQHKLPDLLYGDEYADVYKSSKQIAKRLIDEVNKYRPSIFERLTDFCLNLTANYSLLRTHLLKFLAILPSLDYDKKGKDVKRMFLESMRRLVRDSQYAKAKRGAVHQSFLPFYIVLTFLALFVVVKILPAGLFAFLTRKIVRAFAGRFIAGEKIGESGKTLSALRSTKRDATIDKLGELVVSEKEADGYCQDVLSIIKGLSAQIKRGEKNSSGILRANVSVKISALCSDFKPEAPEYTYDSVAPRLKNIFLTAMKEDVFINMDAEHYRCRDLAFTIFKRVLLETDELTGFTSVGIAVQAYLRDAYIHLVEIIELAAVRKITMPIRLVKGAYRDAETIEACAFNYDAPQFLNKEESDLHFRQLIIVIMKSHPHVQLCLASHNLRDHCFADALRKLRFSGLPKIEHQCLYMTCEALSVSMANGMGWVTRNYVPVGSLLVGMGYLVRRIMENSSMAGVLTMMRMHKKQELAKEPEEIFMERKRAGSVIFDHSINSLSSCFTNTPPVRLYLKDQRASVIDRLSSFQKELGRMYEGKIELNDQVNSQLHNVYSPSDPGTLVGRIKVANKCDTMSAIKNSDTANKEGSWARLRPIVRSSILLKAADTLLIRRLELMALIVYEAGKVINEAAGDVDEAIDFLNFYAREEVAFLQNHHNAIPRGVFAAVPPWNFPLAIPCGMIAAGLVAGNTVLLKSSGKTPLIAQLLVDIFHYSGVPNDVLIHVPGSGEEVGATLINDSRVDGIVFTGSKGVGTRISDQAGKRMVSSSGHNNKQYPVKIITEMGGKNAIIVTANAELDEAVSSSISSCFGHAGQKCSAASRILVDERILDRFSGRFKEACVDICVGKSYEFSSSINPVICESDKRRLIKEGNNACDEAVNSGGKILVNRLEETLPGCCVGPLVLQIPVSLALTKTSYSQKELFGPIVHIVPYKTIEQAILIANATEYALTAGVFSQSQDDIDYIVKRIEAGNIYVNRGCTGARVGVEPFGGFKFSGTGPKAGHHDYLAAFHLQLHVEHEHPADEVTDKQVVGNVGMFNHPAERFEPGVAKRLKLIKNGLYKIVENYSNIFPDNRIAEKTNFTMFAKWLDSNPESFLTSRWYNHNIPGQLSYNDYSMIKEQGLLIACNKNPYKDSLYNLVSAMVVGAGVTILTESADCYASWQSICNYFFSSGVSRRNLKVVFVNEKMLEEALAELNVSFIVIDGNANNVEKLLAKISSIKNVKTKYLCSIHTPMDCPTPPHWEEYLKQFVFTRSMAINTMRHGAPLEID
ncbi:MAG: bifunctional proline dehydrogenase/L-glutamate gamma-semialdehyde dehydrogenase [Candidatus Anammoxibacter sp.]